MGARPPAEALEHLAERFGPVTFDLLADRRGSRTWKITGSHGAVALKVNDPVADSDRGRDKASEIDQEDRHLLALVGAHALSPGYRVDAGAWESGRWLAVRWIDGTSLWRTLAPARGLEGNASSVGSRLIGIAQTWAEGLAKLHAAGWAHADVQPTNTIVTSDGRAAVIDYASACGPGPDVDRIPYRGALTHTTAPEIADAVLTTSSDTHIQALAPADVWGLGGSLFWCWTGRRPVTYEDGTPRLDKLRAIAQGRTAPLEDARPWAFPQFENVVTACLHPEPDARPTAAHIAAALAEDGQ